MMTEQEFEALVVEGIDALPEKIRQRMKNVAICVERRPTPEQRRVAGLGRNDVLFGLYEGVPQTAWGRGAGGTLPDKITIFQDEIESWARTPETIRAIAIDTVWHEVAHHFGLGHHEIRALERKRRKKDI